MSSPIDTLIKQSPLKCLCCGASARFIGERVYSDCWCHQSFMDKCPTRGACALHCKCRDCKSARDSGLWRINWTGRYHIYHAGAEVTLCKRRMPAYTLGVVRVPMLKLIGRECQACAKASRTLAGKAS